MTAFVDHLKNVQRSSKILEDAFGLHVLEGDIFVSGVDGNSSSYDITVGVALGEGAPNGWAGNQGLWFKGVNIPDSNYRLHPGTITTPPVYKTFTASGNTLTVTGGFPDDTKVFVRLAPGALSTDSLPAPLKPKKIYYWNNTGANTGTLSETKNGTVVSLTTAGTGSLQIWADDPVQGTDEYFSLYDPLSKTVWIRSQLPHNAGDFNTASSAPTGLQGIYRTLQIEDYNSAGIQTAVGYSASVGRVLAFLILQRGKLPLARIDWTNWTAFKNFNETTVTWDYAAAAATKPGIGLYGQYYNHADPSPGRPDFPTGTLVFNRLDPVIDMDLTNGSPGIGVNDEWFLVKWEGKIKPEFSETYTFFVTHDEGARLYVNGVELVGNVGWTNNGTHSGTIALTADQLYTIELQFFEGTGNALIKLEWESTSQPREVIPTERLYPKAHLVKLAEAHPKFTAPTTLSDALKTTCFNANSFIQDDGETLKFFSFEQLTAPSFAFTESNILPGTLTYYPQGDIRDASNPVQTRYQADGRDLNSQYLEKFEPPVELVLTELETLFGREIYGDTVQLENMIRYLAEKILALQAKLKDPRRIRAEFDANFKSFQVLPGDLVSVTHAGPDWAAKWFLCLDAIDKSSEEAADDRAFVLLEWD